MSTKPLLFRAAWACVLVGGFVAPAMAQNLVLSGNSAVFTYQAGATNVNHFAFTVNSSGAPLNVTVSKTSGGPWLAVSPSSGTTPVAFQIDANPTGLGPGTYPGSISVASAAAGNSPQTVNVTLNIQPVSTPSFTSLTPFQGMGAAATLAIAFTDANGANDIQTIRLMLNTLRDPSGACYVIYDDSLTLISLIADNGISVAGSVTPGTAGTATNGQCTLDGAGSSVSKSANTVTLNAKLTFKPSFTGLRNIWASATDYEDNTNDWLPYGVWFPNTVIGAATNWLRIFDPFSHSHLYTMDTNEYNTLGTRGYTLEGPAGMVYNAPGTLGGIDNTAWYRLYVVPTNSHFWTSDRHEFLTIENFRDTYVAEGVAAYVWNQKVGSLVPFYRLAYSAANIHHWTTDLNEYNTLGTRDWIQEGIAAYIFPPPAPAPRSPRRAGGGPEVLSAVNAASMAPGPLAPGMALVVYGRDLGGDGVTAVYLDDLPAQVMSSAPNELRVLVPAELAGKSSVRLQVEYMGRRSEPVEMRVGPANPGVFASNEWGRGRAQATNEDGSINAPDMPAARGSVVTVYATGGGLLGLPVTALVGTHAAEVLSAQPSGTRPGAIEVRLRIPPELMTSGSTPLRINVGEMFSQAGVMLSVE